MPGYPLENFETRVEEKYLCSDCELPLKEPYQTYCGHRYCLSCLDEIFRQPEVQMCKKCPQDSATQDSLLRKDQSFPDRAIKRDIGTLPIKCTNAGLCEWRGKVSEYDAHQEDCGFSFIPCIKQGCDKQVMRMDLAAHLEKECAMRQVKCKYCSQEILLKEEKDHGFICPQYPMNCDYCGKKKIPRDKMAQHLDSKKGDCKRLKVACPFMNVGCHAKVDREKLNDHISKNQVEHLNMVMEKHTALEQAIGAGDQSHTIQRAELEQFEQQKAREIKALSDKISELASKISQGGAGPGPGSELVKMLENRVEQMHNKMEEMRHKYVAMETRVATFEGIVAVLNREIEKCSATIEAYERQRRQDREIIESLERKMKSQERIIALKDVALAEQDLRITSLEMTSYDATLLWKIQDFTRKRHDAITGKTTSIYSPCFYTSRTGYKMCARIYLNGDGMGKGSHISLFFVLMRGHFDGLLRWPFRQKVTFMLLDQNNREHVIDAFRPDPTSSSFKRPTSDMNIASGCPLFMPLSQLESTRHAYVRDDAIFLKIIVDTSDLN
ncbi:TNF receptor-associated factor 2-like [Branchiostoma floridae x Branchiostoma belcheri]